ncbi:MAG: methyltransferase domain-containing protein [Caldilineaceae bacterium]|nr:methyltransferase domain-containing protein [Caldilineaceae bacterium]
MEPKELNAATAATRCRWDERYAHGVTPWDTQITPPEVIDFWQSARLPRQGVALDLGCGPGTNVRYLASLGLTAIGVEIAGAPLLMARRRLQQQTMDLSGRVRLVAGDVCLLPFSQLNAAYILDVGCLHSLPPALRPAYVENVLAHLAPGGYYHLYGFDADPANPEPTSGPSGLLPGEVAQRFAPACVMVGETIARPDRRPCRWYLLQRTQ